jgi:hypothetical protein
LVKLDGLVLTMSGSTDGASTGNNPSIGQPRVDDGVVLTCAAMVQEAACPLGAAGLHGALSGYLGFPEGYGVIT